MTTIKTEKGKPQMAKIQVSKFKRWDQFAGESTVSQYMTTLEVIEREKCVAIDGTTIEIDDSQLDGDFYLPPVAR